MRRFIPIFVGFWLIMGAGVMAARQANMAEMTGLSGGALWQGIKATVKNWRQDSAKAYVASIDPPMRPIEPFLIYDNGLQSGWQDWSWADRSIKTQVADETKAVLLFHPKKNQGVYLHTSNRSSVGYSALEVQLRPVDAQKDLTAIPLLATLVKTDGKFGPQIALEKHLITTGNSGKWRTAQIPLTLLHGVGANGRKITDYSGVVLMSASADTLPDVVIRRIALLPDESLPLPPKEVSVGVRIDVNADRHPISPHIYGIAFGSEADLQDLRPGLRRWGGNPNTRYNWMANAWNSARDWHFQNNGEDPKKPTYAGRAAVNFIEDARNAGSAVLFTIPTIGWVSKSGDRSNASQGVPKAGDAPLKDADGPIQGYDPTENRRRTSIRSVARKGKPFVYPPPMSPLDPSPDFTIAQDEFVYFLTKRFGTAAKGGVSFYAMDNEPDLWSETHTDIKPARQGYDDLFAQFQTYASAIKDVDPTAQITGPVSWGWTGFLYSPLDRGDDNFKTYADRKAHGDIPFLLWFLQQAKAVEKKTGRRILDVLDVHYYPQADVYNAKSDPATAAQRIRTVRSLYDPKYSDESWIGEPVRLLPRLKEWIAQEYPGTKIGITEWNFGGDNHISGALTIAETLSIFGREDVYMASYWTTPKGNSPGYLAFKLLLNPEGNGQRGVEAISCRALSSNDARLGAYATTDRDQKMLSLILINKMPATTIDVPLDPGTIKIGNGTRGVIYLLSADQAGTKAQIRRNDLTIASDRSIKVSVPAYSVMLVRIPLQNKQTKAVATRATTLRETLPARLERQRY